MDRRSLPPSGSDRRRGKQAEGLASDQPSSSSPKHSFEQHLRIFGLSSDKPLPPPFFGLAESLISRNDGQLNREDAKLLERGKGIIEYCRNMEEGDISATYFRLVFAYDMLIRINPNNPDNHLDKGKLLFKLEFYKDAVEEYKNAKLIINGLMRDNEVKKAEAASQKDLLLRSPERYVKRAQACQQAEQDSEWAEKEANRLARKHVMVCLRMGEALFHLGDYQGAAEAHKGADLLLEDLRRDNEAEKASKQDLLLILSQKCREKKTDPLTESRAEAPFLSKNQPPQTTFSRMMKGTGDLLEDVFLSLTAYYHVKPYGRTPVSGRYDLTSTPYRLMFNPIHWLTQRYQADGS